MFIATAIHVEISQKLKLENLTENHNNAMKFFSLHFNFK